MSAPVTLEILACPADLGYLGPTVRHVLRQLGGQVDELLFAVDLVPARGGRYADGWGDALPAFETLLEELLAEVPRSRVVYAQGRVDELARLGDRFFGGVPIPAKDCRGSAFEVYWQAFDAAANDLVFHVDGDMLFGGGSPTWVAEAVELLLGDPDCIAVVPLSGPPHPSGTPAGHPPGSWTRYPWRSPAFRFATWTTRLALFSRSRMLERFAPLPLSRPPYKRTWVKAAVNRNPLVAMPEDLLKAATRRAGMHRVDLLGEGDGMWSLHPLLKPPEYLARLDEVIGRVERFDLPAEQLGHYDVVDALVDQRALRRDRRLRRWR